MTTLSSGGFVVAKWQYAVFGFLFGAVVAAAAVYLAFMLNVESQEEKIFDLERSNRMLNLALQKKNIAMLEKKRDNLQKEDIEMLEKRSDELDAELRRCMLLDKINSLEAEVLKLASEKNDLINQLNQAKAQLADLAVAKFENASAAPSGDNASAADEEAKALDKIIEAYKELTKRVTMVGGPMNDFVVKELGLDNAQAAGINEALKNEEERIRKRFAEIAADVVKDKTQSELEAMGLDGMSLQMLQILQKEVAPLMNQSRTEIIAFMKGEKSVTDYISKDTLYVRLGKAMFEERETTYRDVAPYLTGEKEKLFREKYLKPGGFYIKPGYSYEMGKVTRETFEKR
jgi:hypothetical protein